MHCIMAHVKLGKALAKLLANSIGDDFLLGLPAASASTHFCAIIPNPYQSAADAQALQQLCEPRADHEGPRSAPLQELALHLLQLRCVLRVPCASHEAVHSLVAGVLSKHLGGAVLQRVTDVYKKTGSAVLDTAATVGGMAGSSEGARAVEVRL